jgi:hypothetical protein
MAKAAMDVPTTHREFDSCPNDHRCGFQNRGATQKISEAAVHREVAFTSD